MSRFLRFFSTFLLLLCFSFPSEASKALPKPVLSARAAIVVDSKTGKILYSKNPDLKLPPASTTKVMTALLALERLPLERRVVISHQAVNVEPSKADLTLGASYKVNELIVAILVSSSNDAAVALAEAMAGTEEKFAELMNAKAKNLRMNDTHFLNATGLPVKNSRQKQHTTASDLAKLMRVAAKDKRIDKVMGITMAYICGSDGKTIFLKSHNKMLWKTPRFVKGKTGWTIASKHTFVGTNYEPKKKIIFSMLSSEEPWTDIQTLATFGMRLKGYAG
jgi:D-alanyl-D-alanine carboxypeptidase